jgi:hypothetical protein
MYIESTEKKQGEQLMPAGFYWTVVVFIILTSGFLLPEPLAVIIISRRTKTRLSFSFSWYVLFCLLALEVGMCLGANTLLLILPSWLFHEVIQVFFILIGTVLIIIYVKDFITYKLLPLLKHKRGIDM